MEVKIKKNVRISGQYFTPPELTIRMIEKFTNLEGTILDPTAGCGGLIAACIIAGADPVKCYAIEIDEEIYELCKQRLCKLGVPDKNIKLGDALEKSSYNF